MSGHLAGGGHTRRQDRRTYSGVMMRTIMTTTRLGDVMRPGAPASWRPAVFDAVVAIVLAGLIVGSSPAIDGITGGGVVLGVVAALAIAATTVVPLIPAVVVPACLFGYLAAGNPGGPALLAGPVTMAVLGYRAPKSVVAVGVALVIAAVAGGRVVGFTEYGPIGTAGPAWAIAVALLGVTARTQVDRRAERRRQHDLLRRQAVTGERLRIARDLHDSVAHALASINVQSTVADRLLERDPAKAREALAAIRGASGEALDELGWLLNSLRENSIDENREPGAGIDGIGELISRARNDGLTVTYRRDPAVAELPIARQVGAAAYRVVQEALSNVTRHAGPAARVRVDVEYQDATLRIGITDDGRAGEPPASRGTGVGLIGMAERVQSTGGTLEAGPRSPGFSVQATWPLSQEVRPS